MPTHVQKIEALLFLAGEAVTVQELARLLNASIPDIEQELHTLQETLAGHGLTLLRTSNKVQLVTGPDVAAFVQEFLQGEVRELSAAAAETLAIIAYRGPISRHDISAIRGVDSRRIVQQLLLRGLIVRRADAARVAHYVISEEFLQYLGITDVSQLPDFVTLSTDERVRTFLDTSAS